MTQVGVRWSFADLILALCGPASSCFDAHLSYGSDRFGDASGAVSYKLATQLFPPLIQFAPAHCYRHPLQAHLIMQHFPSSPHARLARH
jgi:hypothetical protein